MKLWVDDERPAPAGWHHAKTYAEAYLELMKLRRCPDWYTHVSLDHDLGDPVNTGYTLVCLLEEFHRAGMPIMPVVTCHSANPVGRARIEQVIQRIS